MDGIYLCWNSSLLIWNAHLTGCPVWNLSSYVWRGPGWGGAYSPTSQASLRPILPLMGEWEVCAQDVCAWLILLSHSVIVALICWRHQAKSSAKKSPTWKQPNTHPVQPPHRTVASGVFSLKEGCWTSFPGMGASCPQLFLELVPGGFLGAGPEEGSETCLWGQMLSLGLKGWGSVNCGPGQGQLHCRNLHPCNAFPRNLVIGRRRLHYTALLDSGWWR